MQAEGDARAAATRAEGLAEAAATDAKAEALRKYGEAALAQEIISRLPEIVRAAAESVGQIGSMTVVSTDGSSAVTRAVGQVLGEGTEVLRSLTGIDLQNLMSSVAQDARGRNGASQEQRPAPGRLMGGRRIAG